MSGTKTSQSKNKSQNKRQKEGDAPKVVADPIEVEPKGDAIETPANAPAEVVVVQANERIKRIKKNATKVGIDPSNVESGRAWLKEFYDQCTAHPARKGYDQHWNSKGFIHSGPAKRLPNDGAANMVTLIGDILANREAGGDKEAGAYLDYCINFLQSHRQALQDAREAEILAQAAAIQAKKNA
jgi:hypothetical protein